MTAFALALSALGCGGRGNAPAPSDTAVAITGRVRLAGSTPLEQVMIGPEDSAGTELEVVGDYRSEIRRLSGAKLRATGSVSAGRLAVRRYEILEIAGHVPVVGILEVSGAEASLTQEDGGRVRLHGAPEALLAQADAKVWVILDASGTVAGYGVIRKR